MMDKETSTNEGHFGSHGNDTLTVVENLESSTSNVPNNLGTPALNDLGKGNSGSNAATTEDTVSTTTAAVTSSTVAPNAANFTTEDSLANLLDESVAPTQSLDVCAKTHSISQHGSQFSSH